MCLGKGIKVGKGDSHRLTCNPSSPCLSGFSRWLHWLSPLINTLVNSSQKYTNVHMLTQMFTCSKMLAINRGLHKTLKTSIYDTLITIRVSLRGYVLPNLARRVTKKTHSRKQVHNNNLITSRYANTLKGLWPNIRKTKEHGNGRNASF